MPRVHVSVGQTGGRFAISLVEHLQVAPDLPTSSTDRWEHRVFALETRPNESLDVTRDRVLGMVEVGKDAEPCVFVDTGGPGLDLRGLLLDVYQEEQTDGPHVIGREFTDIQRRRFPLLHLPHGRDDYGLPTTWRLAEAKLMRAMHSGRLVLDEALPGRAAIIRALSAFERGGDSPTSAVVTALAMAVAFPTHGAPPRYRTRGGEIEFHATTAQDPYL